MENFQRPTEGDISISGNSAGTQPYYSTVSHLSQISNDQSISSAGQIIGEHSSSNGLIPNMPNFSGLNSGVGLGHNQRNSPNVLEHSYQLSTASIHGGGQGQSIMHHSQMMPAQHDDTPGDSTTFHPMMQPINGYYSSGQPAPNQGALLLNSGMVSNHVVVGNSMNASYIPSHQGMLLSQQPQPQPPQQQQPSQPSQAPQPLITSVSSDANGAFNRQPMYIHSAPGAPGNPQMMSSQAPQSTGSLLPQLPMQQGQMPGMVGSSMQPQGQMMPANGAYGTGPMQHLHHNPNIPRPVLSASNTSASRSAPQRKPVPWHSPSHAQERKDMVDKIVALLQQRKQNAGPDWHEKLPTMAKRLEEALYHQAQSLEIYQDANTLKSRLQALAQQMGGKQAAKPTGSSAVPPSNDLGMINRHIPQQAQVQTQQTQPPQQPQQPQQQQAQYQQPYSQQQYYPQSVAPGVPAPQHNVQQIRQSQGPMSQYGAPMLSANSIPNYPNPAQQYGIDNAAHIAVPQGSHLGHPLAVKPLEPDHHLHHIHQSSGLSAPMNVDAGTNNMNQQQHRLINISQIQPLVGQPSLLPQPPQQPQPLPQLQQSTALPPQQQQQQPQQPKSQQVAHSARQVSGAGGAPAGQLSTQNDDHRTQVLKQQQQRLLLLRHASKCPHEAGRCTVTPHCAGMKQLWKHIMSCKDQECKMSHCVSSRYVLSHYSKCKDPNCPVCGPVRKAIKANYEKSKNVIENVKDPRVTQALTQDSSSKKKEAVPARPKSQLDPVSCAIYCFTNEQITAHIKSIHEGVRITAAKVKELFLPVLDEILRIPHVLSVFGSPVDPEMFNLPDYFDIIKAPMDLGTVRKRLDSLQYRDYIYFVDDMHLTFDNAMLYNPKSGDIYTLAKQCKREFDAKFKQALAKYESTIEQNRLDPEACVICGEQMLNFEPPVYYCNGTCGQRIKRNAYYYAAGNNSYHWCTACFQELKESQPIRIGEATITKTELAKSKKRHQEETQEGWVQCDGCQRWVHDICGLFNSRRNFSDEVRYNCPGCLVKKRSQNGEVIVAQLSSKTKASDLPRCNMTDFMEARIQERLERAYAETAAILGKGAVEKCPPLVLRQVSCIDKMQPTREGVKERYSQKNYPIEFPCRVKCVTLFQNIDGQDVILFGMYVYEYGHKCPAPNQRRVYVSYLDSVHYLRPKRYRTVIYHEILISYLEYVKRRGFHTAHIWSCPPSKGDDYILYCHPVDQKTPKTDKLQKWYADMLVECVSRGIAVELTDLHTEYMVDPSLDASVLPYFEGDYWTTEAEVIISALKSESGAAADEDEYEDRPGEPGKSKRRVKSKAKASRSTRSARPAVLVKSERDPVMSKLAAIIEPMKNTFFVARLYPKEYADRFAVSRQAEIVSEEADRSPETESQRMEQRLQADVSIPSMPAMLTKVPAAGDQSQVDGEEKQESDKEDDGDFDQMAQCVTSQDGKGSGYESDATEGTMNTTNIESERENATSPIPSKGKRALSAVSDIQDASSAESKCDEDSESGRRRAPKRIKAESENGSSADILSSKGEGDASSAAECVEAKVEIPAATETPLDAVAVNIESTHSTAAVGPEPPSNAFLTCLKDDTEDVDDIQESEHWDTRQAFLNLCQGNHYQFDQLRRAKHSSMMVLYLMHNPDAPKFLPNCSNCRKDILVGARYSCPTCDLDYCAACYNQSGPQIHSAHPLRLVGSGSQDSHSLTEQERRDRQQNLQLHIELLVHATECSEPAPCKVKNCAKMKEFIAHLQSCQQSNKGCPICKRVNIIISVHARKCRKENCRVMNCLKIRERIRNLTLKQQQMDDRRRANVNEMYHNSGQSHSRQHSAADLEDA